VDETDIDIKPWDSRNRLYLKGHWDKLIVVAVFGTERLDVTTIDLSTVKLGQIGVAQVGRDDDDDDDDDDEGGSTTAPRYLATMLDIDRDGDKDLLVMFNRRAMVRIGDITRETTQLTLTGLTLGGQKVVGTDPVKIVR
jgi:hypothetical protein